MDSTIYNGRGVERGVSPALPTAGDLRFLRLCQCGEKKKQKINTDSFALPYYIYAREYRQRLQTSLSI